MTAPTTTLLPPVADPALLRQRVRALAENRPGIYRMVDAAGRVLYVGKAKRVRNRVLSYFRARYPDDKAARILAAASNITWDYVPSEFAAHLAELREIRRHRPPFNLQMNRRRRAAFVVVTMESAPKLLVTSSTSRRDVLFFGPFTSPGRVGGGVRVLNDLLGLRDCKDRMPAVYSGQGDLFEPPRQAACPRFDFGTCAGPCAGLVSESAYQERVTAAIHFLGGYSLRPVERAIQMMEAAAAREDFEAAARWREKFEQLEWLIAAGARARAAIQLLTFVYRDTGELGDERAHLIRHGLVRASYPFPTTPIEREAFRAVVEAELREPLPPAGLLDAATLDEMLLVMSWFRRHPEHLRRTEPLEVWTKATAA
ncbi:MAG: nuclease [Gemmatimonadales bacterium]